MHLREALTKRSITLFEVKGASFDLASQTAAVSLERIPYLRASGAPLTAPVTNVSLAQGPFEPGVGWIYRTEVGLGRFGATNNQALASFQVILGNRPFHLVQLTQPDLRRDLVGFLPGEQDHSDWQLLLIG